jgi:gamma-polyglutamate biosynthesis protein CapC
MIIETLLVGLVVALLWAELTDISPGGIIVPGYLALYLGQPLRVAATLTAAILAVAAYRALAGRLILFGRRRFALMVLLGALLSQAWSLALPGLFAAPLELRVIGWVVPGILASSLVRQKPLPTMASLLAVAVLTFAVMRWVSLL